MMFGSLVEQNSCPDPERSKVPFRRSTAQPDAVLLYRMGKGRKKDEREFHFSTLRDGGGRIWTDGKATPTTTWAQPFLLQDRLLKAAHLTPSHKPVFSLPNEFRFPGFPLDFTTDRLLHLAGLPRSTGSFV